MRRIVLPLASTLLAAALGSGCVRSKVVITSEPEGAVVTMNGENLGTTPVERPFTWYWYYDIVASKDGYETKKERHRFKAPVYLWVPLDLIMEAMPFYVTDTKKVHLVLEPAQSRPTPLFDEAPEQGAGAPGT